uniref:zinc finger protein 329 isoform X3 n=1 Tax=Urocitellus parryii TaxID=9999 RepID=UPI000E55F8E7|nr:zinc finger protein 329 isoform X3 [Urocitellus parryii]
MAAAGRRRNAARLCGDSQTDPCPGALRSPRLSWGPSFWPRVIRLLCCTSEKLSEVIPFLVRHMRKNMKLVVVKLCHVVKDLSSRALHLFPIVLIKSSLG